MTHQHGALARTTHRLRKARAAGLGFCLALAVGASAGCGDETAGGDPLIDAGRTIAADAAVAVDGAVGGATTDAGPGSESDAGGNADATTAKPPPNRVVFVFTAHGTLVDEFLPRAEGRLPEQLPPLMEPLTPLREQMLVIAGLDATGCPGLSSAVNHNCPGTLLSGVAGQKLGDGFLPGLLGGARTIDLVIGDHIGARTMRRHVGIQSVVRNGRLTIDPALTYEAANKPVRALTVPDPLIEQLQLSNTTPLGLRESEAKVGDGEAIARTHLDLITEAFEKDRTRVVTYQLGDNSQRLPWTGDTDHVNLLAHLAREDAEKREVFRRVQRWYAGQVALLATRLDSIPEGSGTLLDHTLIVWFQDVGSHVPWLHSRKDIPVVLIGNWGDALKTGRLVTSESGRLPDLWLTLARTMGVPLADFGSPDAPARMLDEIL